MTAPAVTYVVRQRLMHPRHLGAFRDASARGRDALRREVPQLSAIRRYRYEKDELFFYTFYEFAEDATWGPALDAGCRRIRASWQELAPQVRELTATAYERTWRQGKEELVDTQVARHPLIVERLAFTPDQADREAEWAAWYDGGMLAELVRSLPVVAITRYRAVDGTPRYLLKVNEYVDEPALRGSVDRSGPGESDQARSRFSEGWARFMPYVDDLTRWVLLPD